ncbi:hypothetical protein [Xenorhabdus griffiniae]|nr:hypothetical protein [Xenorhabdus griffiniae]MDC9604138.1 hypothetical protein [Xenorhabdus griffiniae]
MQAIVGFKIWLDEIQAKEKLGQHIRADGDAADDTERKIVILFF